MECDGYSPMKVLVLQHVDVEHPGTLRDCFREDGVHWDVVHLGRGDGIPELSAYDCMLVMGGPQDVWEEDAHPWLVPEKAAIRRFVT
ncbi:MAG: type 1 glutamine amidotransferase, partial [Gammaproteobacteria bacterium]|nr:type 1 glutamine amidotransferase [Gammaproteobacteria bacterium]